MSSAADSRPSLDPSALAGLPGFSVEVLDETASTNAVCAERARAGAPEWTVIVAEHQTAGRGRLDRSWELPAQSGLAFSVLVRRHVSPARWGWLSLVAGLAVAEAIGPEAKVKWPNDVLIDGRKVSGILSELVMSGSATAAVIGIGINVSLTADELPVPTATSLALEGITMSRTTLLTSVLLRLRHRIAELTTFTEAELIHAYAARSATIGHAVTVSMPDGSVVEGIADGVDGDGRLLVAGKAVNVGDVVHARLT
ncbi:biotin--[acetyl-CoA-carboxylase] ligase [Nocardioides baekrokdamisoli]|uniref:biotin--[biotin carboxyl-carrier protein] ligase n=1 Tax=Nocardioides baekrokdamisoli TaxID=1804624 RepID=A0A3G9J0Q2_9ACTN|nr:biotin--[acetyl-CoA-carboxylase] ligase [Nocardioides baekrokdamisoli]BBH16539.1 biotin--[acetyl-CoA-carboxylase] ligase [Nocardioides baekrokdamisoli]